MNIIIKLILLEIYLIFFDCFIHYLIIHYGNSSNNHTTNKKITKTQSKILHYFNFLLDFLIIFIIPIFIYKNITAIEMKVVFWCFVILVICSILRAFLDDGNNIPNFNTKTMPTYIPFYIFWL